MPLYIKKKKKKEKERRGVVARLWPLREKISDEAECLIRAQGRKRKKKKREKKSEVFSLF
jgi:hypothetical protein